ncbi:MAG: tetratricopeptide repeat protein [Synechococcus sp.]
MLFAITLSELATAVKDWLEANEGWLNTFGALGGGIAGVVAVFVAIGQWLGWRRQQRKEVASSRIKSVSGFKIVPPNGDVFPLVFRSEVTGPLAELADRKIPYEARVEGRNVREEMESALKQGNGKLLILGRTGLGKTREAAELVQLFNREGWTVLFPKNLRWLDVPIDGQKLFEQVGTTRKLLLWLDDLNQAMEFCREQRENAEGLEKYGQETVLQVPLQERLLNTIRWFEQCCGTSEIRVVATARNEKDIERVGECSPWDKLQWNDFQNFWQLFRRYELPPPHNDSVVALLEVLVPQAGLQERHKEYRAIALKNDRTFRNVVENLREFKSRNQQVTAEGFTASLRGTWEERYQRAVKRYPLARFVYSAVAILISLQVPVDVETVRSAALIVSKGSWLQKLWWRFRLSRVIAYLTDVEQILEPRDGQFEAATQGVEFANHIVGIAGMIFKLANQRGEAFLEALIICAVLFQLGGENQEAIRFYDKALEIKPNDHLAWSNRGIALDQLDRTEEAITSYDKALEFKPDSHEAWYNRGVTLGQLGRTEEAIASYDKALEFKPDKHEAWYNRGNALDQLGRTEEAIASYDKALEFKPDYHEAWSNRGTAMGQLGRTEEAIASFDKALEFKPDKHEAWGNQAVTFVQLQDYKTALDCLEKAIQFEPEIIREWASNNPMFEDLKSHPRFQSLVYGNQNQDENPTAK